MILLKRRKPLEVTEQTLLRFNTDIHRICMAHRLEFVFYKDSLVVWSPYVKHNEVIINHKESVGFTLLADTIKKYYKELRNYTTFSYMNKQNRNGVHYRSETICQKWQENLTQIIWDKD